MNDIYSATLLFPDGHREVWERTIYNYEDAFGASFMLAIIRSKDIRVIDETNGKLLWYPGKGGYIR
mgnify:FL=1